MRGALCLLFVFTSVLLAQSDKDAQLASVAEVVPPQIETVVSGGYWSRSGQDGSFRLIIVSVGWEELASRVFLQWIRLDHDKHAEIVERTVPVREVAGRWRVISQRFELRGKQSQIVLSAERRVPEAKVTFTITPTKDSYKITSSEK